MKKSTIIFLVFAVTCLATTIFAKRTRSRAHSSGKKTGICIMPNGDTPAASSEAECQKLGGKWTKGSKSK